VDVTASVIAYFSARQCASQWQVFLLSTALELEDRLPIAERRHFMRSVGRRFGRALPLPDCAKLGDISRAMNEIWTRLDWGWVEISDETDHLRLRHYCAPLEAAFGRPAQDWAPAVLEGVYQQWFEQLGAGSRLQVTQVSGFDAMGVELRLGVPA